MMAEAAAYNIDRGAQIIDINMGCPAKKVCNKWAGSALMRDEPLALRIVEAVVAACAPRGVPVTLKMRTGWCAQRNAGGAARGREAGVAMVTVHGRTRRAGLRRRAEYDTIAAVKAAWRIPVVANGDIDHAAEGLRGAAPTGADARDDRPRGAGGRGSSARSRTSCHRRAERRRCTRRGRLAAEHLHDHYACTARPRRAHARKHIGWYVAQPARRRGLPRDELHRRCPAQWQAAADYSSTNWPGMDRMPLSPTAQPDDAAWHKDPQQRSMSRSIEECVRAPA